MSGRGDEIILELLRASLHLAREERFQVVHNPYRIEGPCDAVQGRITCGRNATSQEGLLNPWPVATAQERLCRDFSLDSIRTNASEMKLTLIVTAVRRQSSHIPS